MVIGSTRRFSPHASTGTHPAAQEFLDALAERDFSRVERCFAEDVVFRALIPSAVRESTGIEAATQWLRSWFGEADQFEMIGSEIEQVADRVRIAFRLRLHEDAWYTVEQQAYCTIGADGIEAMDLVCSGFRPD